MGLFVVFAYVLKGGKNTGNRRHHGPKTEIPAVAPAHSRGSCATGAKYRGCNMLQAELRVHDASSTLSVPSYCQSTDLTAATPHAPRHALRRCKGTTCNSKYRWTSHPTSRRRPSTRALSLRWPTAPPRLGRHKIAGPSLPLTRARHPRQARRRYNTPSHSGNGPAGCRARAITRMPLAHRREH